MASTTWAARARRTSRATRATTTRATRCCLWLQEARASTELRGAPRADRAAAHRGIPQQSARSRSEALGRAAAQAYQDGQCWLCAGGAQPACCQRFEARKHSRPAVESCVVGRTSMPAKRITLRVVHWRPGARRASSLRKAAVFFTQLRPLQKSASRRVSSKRTPKRARTSILMPGIESVSNFRPR